MAPALEVFLNLRVAAMVLLLSALGCRKPEPAAVPGGATAQPPAKVEAAPVLLDNCTFETPLVAGVPGSPGHLLPSERNPNGDSELAALMRVMQVDLTHARDLVKKGEVPAPMFARHRRMRCAWPTDVKDRDAAFDALAVAYLDAVKALESRPPDRKAAFLEVVKRCRGCHERACPGPIAAIEQLEAP